VKDSFYEELERVFDKFSEYHMKILLGDFSAIISREDIFKPTIGTECLHEISDDNGVRLVNFATSKPQSQKYDVPTLQHPTIQQLGRFRMGKPTIILAIFW
jgi:hypothetical protein